MDSRSASAAAALAFASASGASPLPLYPPALLSLPDLDRPPAVMETWELEAVAAALPAKKRRLRETFDRLAACSPTPLPFRWEDLDTYISSLQYSVTLRHRNLREVEKSPSKPAAAAAAAALAPAPAAAVSSSLLPVTGGGVEGAGQMRPVIENPRPDAPAPDVLPEEVSAPPPATDRGEVHKFRALRGLVKSKSAAPAATGVHVEDEEGRKRKAPIQEAEEVHVAKRTAHTQEGQAEMQDQEDAAVKKKASPSHGSSGGTGSKFMPVPPGGGHDDSNGLAANANANASAGATVQQVDPVSKVAIVQPELPAPARDATPAANRVRAYGVPNSTSPQRSRPPRPVPVTGRDPEKSKKRKVPSQEAEAASQKVQMPHSEAAVQEEDDAAAKAKVSPRRRPGPGSGSSLPITATAQVDAVADQPICKTVGIQQHEHPATTMPRHASNATTTSQAVPPNYDEVPDVEMEIVQPEEEMPMPLPQHQQVLKEDASSMAGANNKACRSQTQAVIIKSEVVEADEVRPLTLACSNGHAQAGAADAVTAATPPQAAAAVTRHSPNLVQASVPADPAPAPKSRGGAAPAAATASHATRRAPPAAGSGSQQGGTDVSSVPPRGRGGNGLAQSPSCVSAGAGTGTHAAAGAHVPQGSTAAAAAAAAPARRDPSATDVVPASRREHAVPSEKASAAPPNAAGKHALQQQHTHTPKHEPVSASQRKSQEWSAKNHGGRPTTGPRRPVPEAQAAAAAGGAAQRSWSRPGGEGRGGALAVAAAGGPPHGDDNNRRKDGFKGKRRPPMFCDNCGCRGHLAKTCRTAEHLVVLYQKAKKAREEELKQICFRCGCKGHWSYNCRTAEHLVDLYQKDRAAKRAKGLLHQE